MMPTYVYKCKGCGNKFELNRSINDESEVLCPECGSPSEKIFVPVPIVFKGSGFYVTDSANSKNSAGKSSSNGEGSLSIEGAKCPVAKK
ncbi:FmdB family zinc ribbon protein [Thermodesulfobium narugense]|nr:FmdB family zinc ribbon protein [Thermodesulfobium narugense]